MRTCADITCPDSLDTCESGVCFRKYDYFCNKAMPKIERIYCPIGRPTEADCPYEVVIPKVHTMCGLADNGQLIDGTSVCELCKREFIGYVYNTSCAQVPKSCEATESCVDFQCVEIDKCTGIKCGEGYTCNSGICVENPVCNCDPSETCVNKVCVKKDPCAGIYCGSSDVCVRGMCIDKCSTVKCETGSKCVDGYCVYSPIYNGCPDAPCAIGFSCVGGTKCVADSVTPNPNPNPNPNPIPDSNDDSCSTNRECKSGNVCIGYHCVVMKCKNKQECYGSGECVNGYCLN